MANELTDTDVMQAPAPPPAPELNDDEVMKPAAPKASGVPWYEPWNQPEDPHNLGVAGAIAYLPVQMYRGMRDMYLTPGTAMKEGITPEKEIEFGANMALMTVGASEVPGLIKSRPGLAATIGPAVKEFQDTVIEPGIAKTAEDLTAKPPAPAPEGAPPPHPLQSLYDHLTQLQDARELNVIETDAPKPEPTFKDSPAKLAQEALPQPVNSAVTPEDMRGNLGHEPGAYDARGREWINKIDAPDDAREAIERIATQYDYFPESRAGTPSAASRAAVAEAAGIDPAEMESGYFSETFDSDGKVRAVIQALRQTTQDFAAASEKARVDPTEENTAAALEAQMRHTHVLEYTLGARAESGRSLNAWKDLLRETERTRASVKLKAGEQTGEVPTGVSAVVDAANEAQTNLKNPNAKKIGLQKLIDSAQELVDNHETNKRTPVELSPELKGLTDEAVGVLKSLKGGGEKTPAQFQRLINTAENLVDATERHSPTKAPLSEELIGLVDEAKKAIKGLTPESRTPAGFQRLIDAAKKLTEGVQKRPPAQEQLPPDLAGLVDEAKNSLKNFGKDVSPELDDFKRELEHLSSGTGKLGSTVEAAKKLLAKEAAKKAEKETGVAPKVASERGKLMGAAKRLVAAADKTAPEGKVPPSPEMAALMETARQAVGRIKQANLRAEFETFREALNSGDVKAAAEAANHLIDAEGKLRPEGETKPPVEYDQAMAAARRVANADEEAKAKGLKTLPPDLASLIEEAKNAAAELGKKEKSELEKLTDAAEKQAVNMTKQKMVKNPVEALPPELQALVSKSERIVDRFGGIAKGEKAAMLLARAGRTAAEQAELARQVEGLTPNQVARVLTRLRAEKANQPGWLFWTVQQGLISGLITHTKYAFVNTAQLAFERVISPEIAAITGKARGEDVSLLAPLHAVPEMFRAVPDAFAGVAQAFKTGTRVPLESELRLAERGEPNPQATGAQVPYGVPQGPNWGMWRKVFNDDQLASATKVLGIPGRSANSIHTFFKILSERAAAGSRAFEKASLEGEKVGTDQFNARYQHHLDNPTDDVLRQNIEDAYSGTFMEKLGDQTQNFAHLVRNTPLKWLIFFTHIPLNMIRKGIEYSPLALLNTLGETTMGKAIKGELGSRAQNLAFSKMAIGTSVGGYFIMKALNGQATGDYPTDPKERRRWQMMGIQPNSIQANGEWVSLERLGPQAMVARIAANYAAIIQHYKDSDEDTSKKITQAGLAFALGTANALASDVGFETIKNLVNVIENPQEGARFAAWQLSSYAMPVSFVTQFASFHDPYMRVADNLLDGLKYHIPGVRETLLPKRDPVYGEPRPNPGYHAVFRNAIVGGDLAKTEMARVSYFPTPPSSRIGGVKLSPEMYDEYEATAGPLVKRLMDNYTQSPEYRQLPDVVKAREFRSLVALGRSQARLALQAHHPELIQQGIEARKAAIFGKP